MTIPDRPNPSGRRDRPASERAPSAAVRNCSLDCPPLLGRVSVLRGTTVWLAIVFGILLPCSPATAEENLPPELQPYRVSLAIGFEDAPVFSMPFRERFVRELHSLVDRTLGERWELTVVETAGLPRDAATLSRLTVTEIPVARQEATDERPVGFPLESAPDKFLLGTIAAAGPDFTIAVREWDRLTDSLGPLRTATVTTRDRIITAMVASLISVFRPVAMIGEAEDTSVPLSLRAAWIPTPDPDVGSLPVGTLFIPHLRGFDRDGRLDQVRPVPYTLLSLAESDDDRTDVAEVQTALRSPLGSRRGRIEAWAVAAPPLGESTRLKLIRRDDEVPLAGRIVEVRSTPLTPGEKPPPAEATLLTDRSGSVTLPADPERPIVWLTIRSGTAVLMRIPLVPGLERELIVPLGDDVRRLDAEGRLAILTGELVETVAKRATLLAKARAGARAGRYDDADAALAEARTLPSAAAFRRRIAAVATPAAKAADEAGDRLAAARIQALGRKATGLVEQYLKADALTATIEEVEELKRTDPDRDANRTDS